ncbi:MAG TPA: PaaX family transcriptional regulator C-terminal domain-containing protein [Solirubrobacteraceae bacterium]|nr:PaaX family transcriptional regulator C-terminal domain-containing protein [Solirubrobacteraceae bacterium]
MQPQDLVITLLGTYVRPVGAAVWSGGLVELLSEFGFSEGAARVALTRLVRRGLLARERSGRLVFYSVTERCERVLAEGDGRIFGLGHARPAGDGWTILWHQLPDSRRLEHSRLHRRLRFLGFGSVQDSVWVSPHDHVDEVTRLLDELGVAAFATVFVAVPGAGVDALVARAWNLSGLAERYDAFCSEFSRYVRRNGSVTRMSDLGAFVVRTRAVHLFRGFPSLDPELPEDIAPLGRARGKAVAIFEALFEGLREPAQRHFDAVARAPVPA